MIALCLSFPDDLPDEILLMIFEYLPKKELLTCSSVCSRWRSVTQDENLWKEIYLERVKISTFFLTNLMQRGVETLTVKFSTVSAAKSVNHYVSLKLSSGFSNLFYSTFRRQAKQGELQLIT